LYEDFQLEVGKFVKIHDESVSHSLWEYEK